MSSVIDFVTKAKERAVRDDRRWFRANPGRNFRARYYVLHEFGGRSVERYPGVRRQVIVAKIAPDFRIRALLSICVFDASGQPYDYAQADDAELRKAFLGLGDPVAVEFYRQANAAFGFAKGGA